MTLVRYKQNQVYPLIILSFFFKQDKHFLINIKPKMNDDLAVKETKKYPFCVRKKKKTKKKEKNVKKNI